MYVPVPPAIPLSLFRFCPCRYCVDIRFSKPTPIKTDLKPQNTEYIDPPNSPPFIEFTFFYRSHGSPSPPTHPSTLSRLRCKVY